MRTPDPTPRPARPAASKLAPSPWVGFSAVSVGTVMATLDGSIVNVALPTIQRELQASIAGIQWIVAAYLLTISAALLSVGRLGDLLGHRRVFVAGVGVFTAGSVLCGVAPNLAALVSARVLQALGASAMMAMGPAAITAIFPPHERGRALGANASVVALGLTLGPPLGGFIVQHLSWRWLFYVNLPIGVAGAWWAWRALPVDEGAGATTFDWRGAAWIALAVGAAVAAVQIGPDSALAGIALAAASAGAVAGLVRAERRTPSPLVDASLFRDRLFTAGLVSGFLSYAALFSSTLLTPFYLAQVQGLSPRGLGAVLTAVPLALSITSPVSGRISDRIGSRELCGAGMALLAAGLAALSFAGSDDRLATIVLRLALCGLGMGLFQPPNNSAVMGALPRARLGSGGGLLAQARNFGMVVGISLSEAMFRAFGGAGQRGFLDGYRAALLAGAAVAALAGAVSLVRGSAPRHHPR